MNFKKVEGCFIFLQCAFVLMSSPSGEKAAGALQSMFNWIRGRPLLGTAVGQKVNLNYLHPRIFLRCDQTRTDVSK